MNTTTATRTTITTTSIVRVGRQGEKTHRVYAHVDLSSRTGKAYAGISRAYCGSQRFGSGAGLLPLDTPITCSKCQRYHGIPQDSDRTYDGQNETIRSIVVADPTKVLTTDRMGRLIPTEWAAALVEGRVEA